MDTINDDANDAGGPSPGDDERDNRNDGQTGSTGEDEESDISEQKPIWTA